MSQQLRRLSKAELLKLAQEKYKFRIRKDEYIEYIKSKGLENQTSFSKATKVTLEQKAIALGWKLSKNRLIDYIANKRSIEKNQKGGLFEGAIEAATDVADWIKSSLNKFNINSTTTQPVFETSYYIPSNNDIEEYREYLKQNGLSVPFLDMSVYHLYSKVKLSEKMEMKSYDENILLAKLSALRNDTNELCEPTEIEPICSMPDKFLIVHLYNGKIPKFCGKSEKVHYIRLNIESDEAKFFPFPDECAIYISSIDQKLDIFNLFKTYINTIHAKLKSKTNISVLHYTNEHVLEDEYPMFHKVINAYQANTPLHRPLYFEITSYLDRVAYSFLGIKFNISYIADQRVKGDKAYIYKNKLENIDKGNFKNTWWYKYITRSKICARGRVTQNGYLICWFGTVINTAVLCPELKFYIKNNILNKDPPDYNTYYTKLNDNKTITFNPVDWDKLGKRTDELKPHKPTGDVFKAFLNMIYTESYNLEQRTLSNLSDFVGNRIIPGFDPLAALEILFTNLEIGYSLISWAKTTELPLVISDKPDKPAPFLIVQPCYIDFNTKGVPAQIGSYKLIGAGLTSAWHVILGFFCNGTPYVYDSNNIIAETDWPKFNFSNYYKRFSSLADGNITETFVITSARFILYSYEPAPSGGKKRSNRRKSKSVQI